MIRLSVGKKNRIHCQKEFQPFIEILSAAKISMSYTKSYVDLFVKQAEFALVPELNPAAIASQQLFTFDLKVLRDFRDYNTPASPINKTKIPLFEVKTFSPFLFVRILNQQVDNI
eukprot:TRINITY_DN23149_c0_g1_i5.p3 TRINITY_DN23149_c0_g1~~TRINITY_DN23149_c0_g1_i5.p3  ORF type:complete len:115 (-),score=2.37 TRINITY_DN23149_c0_g1_i5:402-746(-)